MDGRQNNRWEYLINYTSLQGMFTSKKLVSGKDYFVFQINKEGTDKGFRPFDSNDCRPTTGMRYLPSAGCAKLIKDNNWKFPHNYPIKL